jgi:alkanesulfonate monooxygenase SsuD/methylene tetrahydromethanopterin reductase-like flavin-dependent oxidoreductase (luciferase family)
MSTTHTAALELGLTPWDFSSLSAASLSAQAVFAEALGYQSFWLPESHFNGQAIPDPLMLLASVAAATRSIRLATTSYLLPVRNPLLAAEQVAVLDHLSQGRVTLGIGRGYSRDTLLAFAIDPSTKRELFEWSYNLMLRAWRGDAVSLHDDGSAAVQVEPRPLQQPHPPVWVAAFGPKALQQVGRLGLPYLASPIETFRELQANFATYDAAVAAAGHTPITVRPVMRTVFVSEDRAAVGALRERLAHIKLPRGLETSPQVDDWAIVGDGVYVRDKLAQYRAALGMSKLIVTRLRVEGVDEPALRDSIARVAQLITAA